MNFAEKVFSVFKRDVFLFITDLVTSVVIARTLGPEAMGLYAVLQLLPTYAEVFGRVKLDQSAVYLMGKKDYSPGEVVFTLNSLSLLTAAVVLGAIFWNSDWIFASLLKGHSDLYSLATLILFVVPIHFLYQNYCYLHIYREDVRDYNGMILLRALSYSVLSILSLWAFRWGLRGVVYSHLISLSLGMLFGATTFHRRFKAKPVFNWPLIKDLYAYGFALYFSGLVTSLNQYFTQLIIALHLAPTKIAYFSMARARAELLNKVPGAMSLILYPRISKHKVAADSTALACRAFRTLFLVLFVSGIMAAILIKPLIFLLYGEAFLPAVIPFWILLPGIVISGATTTLHDYFVGMGRARLTLWISVVPVVIQIALSLLLIPRWEVVGGAFALSCALIVTAIIQIVVFGRVAAVPVLKNLSPTRADLVTMQEFILSRLPRFRAKTG